MRGVRGEKRVSPQKRELNKIQIEEADVLSKNNIKWFFKYFFSSNKYK